MNRREFFGHRQLALSAGQVLQALDQLRLPTEVSTSDSTALLRFSRPAMATTFEMFLPLATPSARDAARAALDEVDCLETQLSAFRDTSEISSINRHGYPGPVAVEPRLFALLGFAAKLSVDTNGAFDLTTGPLTRAWGFFNRQGHVPTTAACQAALTAVGMDKIILDRHATALRFTHTGVELNLGSIGKGYALDQAAQVLRERYGVTSALLHGGHSSIYGFGTGAGDPLGWSVGIRHPWQPQRRLALIRLQDRALGTSAASFQHFDDAGRKLGHILDPRTGWPAEGIASASAVAPTAAAADALATAFFVMGVEGTRDYCARHPGIGAVLLPDGESASPVVLGLAGHEVQLNPRSSAIEA
jgi:thiamine biosynthesis lipoprotein